jgi:hypothetical protein
VRSAPLRNESVDIDDQLGDEERRGHLPGRRHVEEGARPPRDAQGLGVLFASDGFQQSSCAAPTIYLLVIDTAGKTVDGVELTPSDS